MQKTQGSENSSHTYAVVGSPDQPRTEENGPYGPVVEQRGGDLETVTFSIGRTISLGNYEFVRILIGAKQSVPDGGYSSDAFADVESFVCEILAREEALVRKRPRENGPLPVLSGINRSVWVEYGLTLNAGVKFESHKVDVGLTRPIADDEDMVDVLSALQRDLSVRVNDKRTQLRGA